MRCAPWLLAFAVACEARGAGARHERARDSRPQRAVASVASDGLCVTSGRLTEGRVEDPTFRAVALDHAGDAAALKFVMRGETKQLRELDSGDLRRQLGLKLRSQDSCNLVYVMWRFSPKQTVEVQVKRNAGARTSKECGARGYKNVKPRVRVPPPAIEAGREHELRAEINGNALTAWIDGQVVWQGTLPSLADGLAGPAGVRADNVDFELVELRVDEKRPAGEPPACKAHPSD